MGAFIYTHTCTYPNVCRSAPLLCRLIKMGVNQDARTVHGQTPADKAREKGHTLLAQLLDRAAQDDERA